MSKMLENLFYSKVGQSLMSALGVKPALPLNRYEGSVPWVQGKLLLAKAPSPALSGLLETMELKFDVFDSESTEKNGQYFSALLDATEFKTTADLAQLKTFFGEASKCLEKSSHVVILGKSPSDISDVQEAAVMESLNGFTRSLAKEYGRKGITANVLYSQSIDGQLTTPLNTLLSHKASYITGQPLYLQNAKTTANQNWQKPLTGKIALVTGAAQGIGAAIAQTLHRDGATIIGLDIPPAKDALENTLAPLNGIAVATDITSEQAVEDIRQALDGKPLDILVHNAGVIRDKTLARMPEHFWDMTVNINLAAPMSVTQGLEQQDLLADNARVICISSISGIAGNVGQTNYSASKSGVAGYVRKQAKVWKDTGKTINAIAPGFIETQMTDEIPFMTREVGRRMNSLSQGGKPQDVAEGVALFAQPGSYGLNGQVLRVCGQSLLGA